MELNMEQRVRWLVLLATVTVVPIHPQQPQSPSPNNPQTAGAVRQMAPAADANLQGGRSPAARYSPLAAGGYRGQHISWYDALLHSLNHRNVDWGMSWEKRR